MDKCISDTLTSVFSQWIAMVWLSTLFLVGCSGGTSPSFNSSASSGSSANSTASSMGSSSLSSASSSSSVSSSVSSSNSSSASSSSSSASSANSSSSSVSSIGPLTINQWQSLTGAPLNAPITPSEWSTGESRGIKDNATGDLLLWFGGPGAAWRLLGSHDNGATWVLVASDVTNPGNGFGYPNIVVGVAQDSVGDVHMLSHSTNSDHDTFYLRLSLIRSGGHVTGHTIVQTPIALPSRNTDNSVDIRGDIKVIRVGGQERVAYVYQPATSSAPNTVLNVYGGISTTLNINSQAQLVGLNGTGGDSLIFRDTGNTVRTTHLSQSLVVQNPANEDLYFVNGQVNGDYAVPVSHDGDNDLIGIRYTRSGTAFAPALTTTIAGDSGTQPFLMAVDSDGDKAWVMYMHPDNGVSFGYFDTSGSFVPGPISPLATANRTGFGAFSARAGKIWAIYHTYGPLQNIARQGRYSFYNGTSWSNTVDMQTADNNGMGTIQWNGGVSALRWTGNLGPQQQTDAHIATLYGE